MIRIETITTDRRRFLDLLLLGDEQLEMIERYLDCGELFALYDGDLCSVCIVVPVDEQRCELKNIATYPPYQGRGYASALIGFICARYKGRYDTLLVGTGETPGILSFYERNGFRYAYRVKDFFIDHYDHPIFEEGIQLTDMIYLQKEL